MRSCVSCDVCDPDCPVHEDGGGLAQKRPFILISPRLEPGKPYGEEVLDPNECTTKCFVDAIFEAGGLPVMMNLTDDERLIRAYVERADGIAVPGGPDVDPREWGVQEPYDESLLCRPRDAFELPLIRIAVELDKPLFTVCRGTHALNVALGGTLNMDVPSVPRRPGSHKHDHVNLMRKPSHSVLIEEGSLLSRASGGVEPYEVNSAHHCCVERIAPGLVLSARADDGIPECVELPGKRFVLGVQWHPEYTWYTCDRDFNIWKSFVDACR